MQTRRLMAIAAVLSLVAGACANTPSPGASTAASAAPSSAPASAPASAAPTGPNAELTAALAGQYKGTTVEMLGQWIDAEGKAFDESLQAFRDATGINVVYSGIANYETVLSVRVDGGLAPDVAEFAQSSKMRDFAADGKLIDLGTVLDADQVKKDYSQGFIDAGTADGKLYGVYYKQDLKSIVWYPVKAFADKGYQVPTTWDELVALSDKIVTDGSNPWCTTQEHKDVSGWVATDWIEDVLLRTAPAETYDKWLTHEIPFNDPAVLNAAGIVSKMFFTEGYTYGGSTRLNATWVGDSQTPMFDPAGPKCWMHKQAAWIPDFWPKDGAGNALYKPGVDSSFFYFPAIDAQYGNPVLGGSDMVVMFKDRPEVRAFLQWLISPDAVKGRIATGGFLSANNSVPPEWYTGYPITGLAEIAREATVSRADASDSMPKEIGGNNGAWLKAMVKWVSQNGEGTDAIFNEVEAAWPPAS
jgi:alpha-glucoside transport system substrate-binding protein